MADATDPRFAGLAKVTQPPGAQFRRDVRTLVINPPADPRNPQWRKKLRIASFKGAPFYVEQQGRASGRRTVLHQYPKRDLPYAEDMGRDAIRYQMTGYLVMAPNWVKRDAGGGYTNNYYYHEMFSNYDDARDLLEEQLMSKSPGRLLDPYNPRLSLTGYGQAGPLLFMCDRYSITETRERGGMCTVEMSFVEAGIPGNMYITQDTAGQVAQAAAAASSAGATQTNAQQAAFEE